MSCTPRPTNLSHRAQPQFKQISREATPESDLSARLRSLRNGSLSPSPGPKTPRPTPTSATLSPRAPEDSDPLRNPLDSDDKTLEELLAELGPEDQWELNPDEPDDIQKLLNEAKTALPQNEKIQDHASSKTPKDASPGHNNKGDKNMLTKDLDMSAFALDDEDNGQNRNQKLEDESREAQDIVAKFMDEVDLERKNEPESTERGPEGPADEINDEGDFSALALPSPPSKLPDLGAQQDEEPDDFASSIASRMAALGVSKDNDLGLPSAPTFKPTSLNPEDRIKKYTDEEIETWCVICQDDATIKCLGCDGDLYCAKCWREGHVGPDVGWEERRHKWLKYRKPN